MFSKALRKKMLDMGLPESSIIALEHHGITSAEIRRFMKQEPDWLKKMIPIIQDQQKPENKGRVVTVIEINNTVNAGQ
jgi:hypothetical protein